MAWALQPGDRLACCLITRHGEFDPSPHNVGTHRVLCDQHQAPWPGEPRRPRGHVLGSLRACTVGRCTLASVVEPQKTDPLEFSRACGNAVTATAAPHPVRWGARQPAGEQAAQVLPSRPRTWGTGFTVRAGGNWGRPCPRWVIVGRYSSRQDHPGEWGKSLSHHFELCA